MRQVGTGTFKLSCFHLVSTFMAPSRSGLCELSRTLTLLSNMVKRAAMKDENILS